MLYFCWGLSLTYWSQKKLPSLREVPPVRSAFLSWCLWWFEVVCTLSICAHKVSCLLYKLHFITDGRSVPVWPSTHARLNRNVVMLCLLTYVLELFYGRAVRYQGAGRTRSLRAEPPTELCTCCLDTDAKKSPQQINHTHVLLMRIHMNHKQRPQRH